VLSDTFHGVPHFVADPTDGRLHEPTLAAEVPKALALRPSNSPALLRPIGMT
jgi:hypothetical protein